VDLPVGVSIIISTTMDFEALFATRYRRLVSGWFDEPVCHLDVEARVRCVADHAALPHDTCVS
jgi:chorismate mutase